MMTGQMFLVAKISLDNILVQMAPGMIETTKIFFLTLLFSLPLGWLITYGRNSKYFVISGIFKLYISIMRGTPLMLQLFVIFYGPSILFKLQIDRFSAVILAFTLNYAAYFAEIYRSGIEAMPKGQYEAANMLGYNKLQTFFKIIFPQVIKIILPSVTNEVICLVKDTSLAFSIAYAEMFTIAKQIVASQSTMMPFVVAAVFYYVFNFLVAGVMSWCEKKMNYYS